MDSKKGDVKKLEPGHTIGSPAATENRIPSSILDGRNDGAWWCSALNEDQLVLEIRLDTSDSYREQLACVPHHRICRYIVPSILFREPEMSFTQPSQVIGTEKVVYEAVSAEGFFLFAYTENGPGRVRS